MDNKIDEEIKSAFRQWKFVHVLLKSMVMNTARCIYYLRLTPENIPYVTCLANVKDKKLKRIYAATLKALDDWFDKRARSRIKEKEIYKVAFQILMTVPNYDYCYKELLQMALDNIENMTDSDIQEYQDKEVATNIKPQTFRLDKTNLR